MVIGTCRVELMIPGSNSLKDRRQAIKSLVEHLRNKFNISVAEVDDPQVWRRAIIGIAVVSGETTFANQVLNKVVDTIEADPRGSIIDYEMEML